MAPTMTDLQQGFVLGPWTVIPERGLLQRGQVRERLEPMVVDVLMVLARHQGSVVTRDQLVHEVWNDRCVTDEAIVAKIATLRHKLGDDARNPTYIETIPRRGYRLIMPIRARETSGDVEAKQKHRRMARIVLSGAIAIASVALVLWWIETRSIESVAVLSFKNLCDDSEKCDPWVAGFREELFVNLGGLPSLKVAKGPAWNDDKTAQQLARELDVEAIIHGTMRAYDDEVSITVEIIESDGFQKWSRKFDHATEDMYRLQETVARQVRTALGRDTEEPTRTPSYPRNRERHDKYTNGIFFLEKRDMLALQRARTLFEETIEIDPAFGPAYLRLAVTLLLLSDYSVEQRREIFQKSIDIADRGARADPRIRRAADMIHGFVHHQYGQWQQAADAYASAFLGRTVLPTAYHWHSRLLSAVGLLDRSLEQAIAARSLEPASQVLNSRVANAYLWIGDMPNARHFFGEANSMGVGAPIHHFGYTMFLIREQRLEEARASARHAHRLLQADDWWVDPVFDGLANPDDPAARDLAYETIERMVTEGVPPYITMISWALFGEADRAMQIAMRIADSGTLYAHESAQVEIFYLKEMKAVRDHEDFPILLRKLGLTDFWSGIGCRWSDDQVLCDPP